MEKILIDSVDYYESKAGLMTYLKDRESQKSWYKIVTSEDDDFLPNQFSSLTNWTLQTDNNGKV